MSGWYEAHEGIRAEEAEVAGQRRRSASADYGRAAESAKTRGLVLSRCSESHYQLKPAPGLGEWLLNLYPGNGRVYGDRSRPRGPRLNLSPGWSLIDAVNKVISLLDQGKDGADA